MSRILQFKEAILRAEFNEATWDFKKYHFYRHTSEKVAFILNLDDFEDCIRLTYGYTSIADEDFFKKSGEDNNDIKLRFSSIIKDEMDEAAVADAVKNIYDKYYSCSKDEILTLKKERQKLFLQKIHSKLKPLGFKKKAAKWIMLLENDFCLEFEAQKSQFSDEYYFNISVYYGNDPFPPCYYTRLITNNNGLYNWQLMTDEELYCLLDDAIENHLFPIINSPLSELGGKKYIWQDCNCSRNKCNTCWVQKNRWEAKEYSDN